MEREKVDVLKELASLIEMTSRLEWELEESMLEQE